VVNIYNIQVLYLVKSFTWRCLSTYIAFGGADHKAVYVGSLHNWIVTFNSTVEGAKRPHWDHINTKPIFYMNPKPADNRKEKEEL
jgi:hypothetical protein